MANQEKEKVPACIGVIMDGNRRWARRRGFPVLEGHRSGYQKLKDVLSWASEAGIRNVIVYALSTENWNRSQEEVGYLLNLFRTALRDDIEQTAKEEGARIVFIGDVSRFPDDIQNMMRSVMERTKDNQPNTLVISVSYGGRAEIVHAVNRILEKGIKPPVTVKDFANHLWTADIPDPDLIIRTGGEMRLSNFLPWQSVYSELFFTETHWPDFSRGEFEQIVKSFAERDRRRGV